MVDGDRLEGWACGFYAETQPPRRTIGQVFTGFVGGGSPRQTEQTVAVGNLNQYDWHAEAGTIIGRRDTEVSTKDEPRESRLYYFRPLLDGDSVAYEFLYEPGQTIAHPSLERLAFQLEPSGVKLHWLTDATEDDRAGLKPDNAVEAPEFSRIAGPLPLKPGTWNQATLRLEKGIVQLDLNGVRIYEYPLEAANQRIFGFYHDPSKTTAKIRDVVLRGHWPDAVPSKIFERREANPTQADRRARNAMIEERFQQLASTAILAESRHLPLAEKYDLLFAYVVRNSDHIPFRLRGELSPTDPAPPVARGPGGEIESPAIELIATAKALGRLDELADRVEKGASPIDRIGRPNLAMLALVRIAQGKDIEAKDALDRLNPLLEKLADDAPEWMRWPELVAASAALERPELRALALTLLEILDKKSKNKGQLDWGKIVQPVLARGRRLAIEDAARPMILTTRNGSGWSPVSIGNADSRGKGLPSALWTFADQTWMHTSGHFSDHIYFNSPLRGNFEVECELTSFEDREVQLSYAGLTVALQSDLKNYQLWHHGRTFGQGSIRPPIKSVGPWYAYKLTVKDGTCSAFVDGRKIHESKLGEDADPWLAMVSQADRNGGVRNLKISGQPVIPETLNLSRRPDLDGWLTDYYGDANLWKKQGDEIIGLKYRDAREPVPPKPETQTESLPDAATPGSRCESVLKYNRPMLEDGEISYEFFQEPGKVGVHPSLDRLTFLIEPDGLKIHWMTDAEHDRTGLLPDNVAIEPDCRRGPNKSPLRPGEWNRLKLATVGDEVTITLNDVLVYQRRLEPTNHRDFGLFHFADETEVKVRNVTYKGQWPKTLPRSPR